ncbi:MAG: protein kinase domain-containing protein, partial [Solirubrobacterales bacterium]
MDDELLMGRFRVLERIGSGGMGTVYRAFDERLQRQVAVKEIASAEPERVLREAQAAARLNHPGIVTLYELGEREGHAVLVSELVPGLTLARMRAAGVL